MARKHSPNEVTQAVPTWAPDARGARVLYGVASATNRALNGARAMIANPQAGGWLAPKQEFRTVAAPARGGRAYVQPAMMVSDERSVQLSSPSMRVFMERSARGIS